MISIKIQINFGKKKSSQKKNKLFSPKCNFLTRKISPAVFFSTIILSLFLAMGINLAFAWTDPGANPPSGNVATPINVSGTYQTKSGGLRVDSLRTDGDVRVDGGNIYDPSGDLWVEGEDDVHVKIDRNDNDSNRYFAVRDSGNTWRFLVYENGNTYIRNNLRVPIIYDRNNTSYYGDFASYSRLNQARLNYLSLGTGINTNYRIYATGRPYGILALGSTMGGRFEDSDSSARVYAAYGGYDILANGTGRIDATSQMRAPIYYDRDNTSYYVNPAGTSKLNCINLGGTTECSWPSGTTDTNASTICNGTNVYLDGDGHCDNLSGLGAESDTLDTVSDRGRVTNQVLRFPKMEDYNNTGYYVDPSWISYINKLETKDNIVVGTQLDVGANLIVGNNLVAGNGWGLSGNQWGESWFYYTTSYSGRREYNCPPGTFIRGIEVNDHGRQVIKINCSEL